MALVPVIADGAIATALVDEAAVKVAFGGAWEELVNRTESGEAKGSPEDDAVADPDMLEPNSEGRVATAAPPTEDDGTEADTQVGGFALRLGWAWDRAGDEVPPWCSSVEFADRTLMSRRRWRAGYLAWLEQGEDAAQTPADTGGRQGLEPGDSKGHRLPDAGIRWVGRALETDLSRTQETELAGHRVRPYVNRLGFISLAIDRDLKHSMTAYAHRVDPRENRLLVSGRVRARHDQVEAAEFMLVGRGSQIEFATSADLDLDAEYTSHDAGRNHYAYAAQLEIPPDRWAEIDAGDNFDAWLRLRVRGEAEPVLVRVNKIPFATRLTTRASTASADQRVLSLAPYYTFKAKALSAKLEVFDAAVHAAMQAPVPARDSQKPVWIIGEMPYKAQDNGLHFFRWMRQHHPEVDAYYVIEADSPERANLGDDAHVVEHGSVRHVVLALQAERFIGTHHAEFLYPSRNPDFVRRLTGSRVFLQHGVMGTKWMVPNYGKRSSGFDTELFLASSEREKKYLVHDFGYDPDEVVVTGLSRFDRLLGNDVVENPRQVLIMPTWRDWLQYEEAFLDSEYFQRWRDLLTSERFAEIVRRHRLDVVLCLHPNMQRFTEHFRSVPARVVSQGEESVQDLMMASACMITDYSSVGFDFSFQHRPVIYFQFDREAFLGRNGSHLDLDAELPGFVETGEDGVLRDLDELAARQFRQPEELQRRSDVFLDHRDQESSRRVFDAVLAAPGRPAARSRGELSTVPEALFRRFRRHRAYFPLMKWMSRGARMLPVRDDVLLFESGLGKQYADSPRYLYEELLARGDTRRKVWVYSGPQRFPDPQTIVIKRLSPSYYWYVARAGLITVNQNLPFYLRRHRAARYVQTWHGTPLKRMQHDIAEVTGRPDDYLARVEAATAQWTHLLSPSPYATEAFRSAFRYDGPVVEEGYPRNDPLLAPDAADLGVAVRRRLDVTADAPVVLYAPTFRDDQSDGRGKFGFELPFDLHELMASLPEDAVLLLRMHVLVASRLKIPQDLADRVIDVSRYPEIQELYLASDVLVTDYSSVFFDAALLRRPIVFHAYDLDAYRDDLRGFYLDYEKDLPGPITRTPQELAGAIRDGLENGIDETARDTFLARFAPKDDGRASARVVDALYQERPRAQRSRMRKVLGRFLRR